VAPLLAFPHGVDISLSTETPNFRSERKWPSSLIKLVENSNFDNLYSKPECHAVSKAFSISKNIEVSSCDVHGNETGLP
jgi:hypothetical protein